eukprot:2186947-Ditylum_brightwellii.AAC.1
MQDAGQTPRMGVNFPLKGLAQQPKPQRRPRQRGSPPKTGGGAPALLPSAPHQFLEGKGIDWCCT